MAKKKNLHSTDSIYQKVPFLVAPSQIFLLDIYLLRVVINHFGEVQGISRGPAAILTSDRTFLRKDITRGLETSELRGGIASHLSRECQYTLKLLRISERR